MYQAYSFKLLHKNWYLGNIQERVMSTQVCITYKMP